MLDYIIKQTSSYIDTMPKDVRKKYGQFFTSKETAIYMAGLYSVEKTLGTLSVLDTGAGSGILSAALLERLQKIGIKGVNLTCYEVDENILELLKSNLEYIRKNVGITLKFQIINKNYITTQSFDFNHNGQCSTILAKYDLVIGNPPYLKLSKEAPEALAMSSICYGAPNMYFLFAAMALFNLKKDGEMVFIIPRSWTSGAYFKKFREYFLSEGKIEHIHLFVSRNKVFETEKVLQETIIIKVRKTYVEPKMIEITSSNANNDFNNIQSLLVPYNVAVSNTNFYVYLVTTKEESELLATLDNWKETLMDLGMKMKTGLTVDFRNRDLLRDNAESGAIPLFYSQHIKNGKIIFPIGKSGEYLINSKSGLVQANKNYLFVKRFSSKEEKRRLQCGIYLAENFSNYSTISTQNKINFIDGTENELAKVTVYGLYVLFNSKIYDMYYRILNGSTQVNATEINTIPMPPIYTINKMGIELMASGILSEENCDRILEEYLNVEKRGSKRISSGN